MNLRDSKKILDFYEKGGVIYYFLKDDDIQEWLLITKIFYSTMTKCYIAHLEQSSYVVWLSEEKIDNFKFYNLVSSDSILKKRNSSNKLLGNAAFNAAKNETINKLKSLKQAIIDNRRKKENHVNDPL